MKGEGSLLKSCFCVFLSVALAVFLSLSVFSESPNNEYNGNYSLRTITITDSTQGSVSKNYSSPLYFGDLYIFSLFNQNESAIADSSSFDFVFDFDSEYPFNLYIFYSYNLPIGEQMSPFLISSIYYYASSEYLDPSVLESKLFLGETSSYTGTFTGVSLSYDLMSSSTSDFSITSVDLTGDIGFYGISSLESGHQRLTISSIDSLDMNTYVPFGMFIDFITDSDPIFDFETGSISFSEAAQLIRDDMNTVLNDHESSDTAKQMAIAIADNKLDQLQEVSNNKFAVLVDQFDSSSTVIVDYYINSGSINITPALDSLNSIYSDYLTQTTSPEQGILINSQYSVKLAQLQTVFEVNYKRQLDVVISDQDMINKEQQIEKVDSLLQIEDEALQIFDESEYQSQLVFQSWISQFSGDVTVYRSIFDFLFEDSRTSRFQPFLTIPFSLVLVGVLLSTTTVVFRRRG